MDAFVCKRFGCFIYLIGCLYKSRAYCMHALQNSVDSESEQYFDSVNRPRIITQTGWPARLQQIHCLR